jgi:thiopeptide-type bacteriocin biosynthesis protein
MYAAFYGTPPTVHPSRRVLFDDLVVGVRDQRFYVRWTREDVEVRGGAWTMYNPALTPAPIRFITEIRLAERPMLTGFAWGTAARLPRTPRVRRGRTILSPARWNVEPGSAISAVASSDNVASWEAALDGWRAEWRVPRLVQYGDGERRLLLDLDAAWGRVEFRAILRAASELALWEYLPTPNETWLQGPLGRYRCELAIPMILDGIRPWSAVGNAIIRSRFAERQRPPGSDWLSVDFYAPAAGHDALVAGPLQRFARELTDSALADGWFYVRYRDDADHVRFRIHGEGGSLTAHVLPGLNALIEQLRSGAWIARAEYRSYERELDRYGGTDVLAAVEALYCADSALCAAVIEALMCRRPEVDRRCVVAWTIFDLMSALSFDPSLVQRGVPSESERVAGQVFRRDKAFLRNVFAGDVPPWLGVSAQRALEFRRKAAQQIAAHPGFAGLGRERESIIQSMIHMHCNRMLGTDMDAEATARALVARTERSLANFAARP